MSDASRVAVTQAFNDLLEYSLSVPFFEASVRFAFEVTMQRAIRHVLHDQYNILARVNDFVQLDDVLMLHLLHQFYFTLNALSAVRLLELVLLVDLHGDFSVGGSVQANAHNCISALTNLLAYYIILEAALLAEHHGVVQWVLLDFFALLWHRLLDLLHVGWSEHLPCRLRLFLLLLHLL